MPLTRGFYQEFNHKGHEGTRRKAISFISIVDEANTLSPRVIQNISAPTSHLSRSVLSALRLMETLSQAAAIAEMKSLLPFAPSRPTDESRADAFQLRTSHRQRSDAVPR